jgi:hypothetical protein
VFAGIARVRARALRPQLGLLLGEQALASRSEYLVNGFWHAPAQEFGRKLRARCHPGDGSTPDVRLEL